MIREKLKRSLFACWLLTLASFALRLAAQSDSPSPRAPVAKKVPKVDVVHGEQRVDNLHWLRDKSNPDVAAYLEAENAYTDAMMKPTEKLQEKLYQEMLGRIKETDLSVPQRDHGYYYYYRTEQGKQYPIICRRKGSLDTPEQITLDPNEVGKGHKFFSVSVHAVSDDGRLLAFTVDTTGFRQYTLSIKDLESGQLLPDQVEKVGSVVWAGDNTTLFYTVEDEAKRQYRLYRHQLGRADDELVYEEEDEKFELAAARSRSRDYIFLSSDSQTASEVRFVRADQPAEDWKIISPREPEHEYDVDHHGDRFYIRTNKGGRNFRLVSAPVSDPGQQNWKEVIAHRTDVMLSGMDFFSQYYVLFEREGGLPFIRVTDLGTGQSHRIEFPEATYDVFPTKNPESDSTSFRYNYESLVTPLSVFEYDMANRESKLLKQTEVLGGYDAEQYESERVFATAADGTRIPISLVHKKEGYTRDGSHPMFLTGYGSYGISNDVEFSSNHLSFLDRGASVAFAHVRGGGEMGKAWHDQGRMLNKKNTFTDFIATAEYLIAEKYTSNDRLIIEGASAGGLLVGAATNMRPGLFKAVVSHVPFVDVINTMLDPSLPLTVTEYEEWGDPRKKEEYDYIKSYCPYTNLASKAYPAILVKTSFNDSQVMYWEPAKYVAKLRTLKTDNNLLLLKTNMDAGHGGSSGRYDHLHEDAFDYAFILTQLGIKE